MKYTGKLDKLVQSKKTKIAIQKATKDSFEWFKSNVGTAFKKKITSSGSSWITTKLKGKMPDEALPGISITVRPKIGYMYFYIYDPKWKDTLPYYDMFPLVIPIDSYDNGFLGLNFHYLPIQLRAKLLDILLKFREDKSDKEYLNISYKLLKGLGNSIYKPTIKRYLWSQFRSPFAEINFNIWDRVIFLPVEDFKKADKNTVWSDSKSKI